MSGRTFVFAMEKARLAGIQAWHEGDREPGSKEWTQRVMELMEDKDPEGKAGQDFIRETNLRATREAERMMFQGDMGTVGRYMEVVQKHPIGQVYLPFLRALFRIRGWAIDWSPLGAAVTLGDVMRAQPYRMLGPENGVLRFTRNLGGLVGGPYADAYKGSQVGKGVADLDRRMLANLIGSTAFFWMLQKPSRATSRVVARLMSRSHS